jgi:hypothetical protein
MRAGAPNVAEKAVRREAAGAWMIVVALLGCVPIVADTDEHAMNMC